MPTILDNPDATITATREHLHRSLGQRVRYAKADIRAIAAPHYAWAASLPRTLSEVKAADAARELGPLLSRITGIYMEKHRGVSE